MCFLFFNISSIMNVYILQFFSYIKWNLNKSSSVHVLRLFSIHLIFTAVEEEGNKVIDKYSIQNFNLYSIPSSFKVKSGDVDVNSGLWRLMYVARDKGGS